MTKKKQVLAATLAFGLIVSAQLSYADSKMEGMKAQSVTTAQVAQAAYSMKSEFAATSVEQEGTYTIEGKFIEVVDQKLKFKDSTGSKYSVDLNKLKNLKAFNEEKLMPGSDIKVTCEAMKAMAVTVMATDSEALPAALAETVMPALTMTSSIVESTPSVLLTEAVSTTKSFSIDEDGFPLDMPVSMELNHKIFAFEK